MAQQTPIWQVTWLANDCNYPITEPIPGATKMAARGEIIRRELEYAKAQGKPTAFKEFLSVERMEAA